MNNLQKKAQQQYTGESGRIYHEHKRSIPQAAYAWVSRLRVEKIAPYISGSDTVLEFGVGTGWNLAALKCRRKVGYDLAAHLESELKEHDIDFVSDIEMLQAEAFDAVICHHALEHTPQPGTVLEQIKRLLKPHGRLLLFVPFEKESRYRRYNPDEPNHHLYAWNVQTLGNLVAGCGFEIDSAAVGPFGYDRFSAQWSVRLGLGEQAFRIIRRLVRVISPMQEVRIAARKL